MEKYFLENNIQVFYVEAESFPDGVKAAFEKLHSLLGVTANRRFFGISFPGKQGQIIYRAAVEENYPDEGKALGCESFTIRKGQYISLYIQDFMKNIPAIGQAFEQLLKYPEIDPEGYCLEIYEGMNNVRCMVPVKR